MTKPEISSLSSSQFKNHIKVPRKYYHGHLYTFNICLYIYFIKSNLKLWQRIHKKKKLPKEERKTDNHFPSSLKKYSIHVICNFCVAHFYWLSKQRFRKVVVTTGNFNKKALPNNKRWKRRRQWRRQEGS